MYVCDICLYVCHVCQVPFVTQQPTGMMIVGDVLFVAGELDIMAFDMSSSNSSAAPVLLATCGAACARVGNATGQNFHSMDYRLQEEEGRHLLFVSAQIDNAIGCVEIVDPQIVKLLLSN